MTLLLLALRTKPAAAPTAAIAAGTHQRVRELACTAELREAALMDPSDVFADSMLSR